MNPYLILKVPFDADDKAIRKAYLEAIKEATPEKNPNHFQALTEAYDRIKDQTSRHQYILFNKTAPGDSPLDAFLRAAPLLPTPQPLPVETMKEFLRSCAKP